MVIVFFERKLHDEYNARIRAMRDDIRRSSDSAIDTSDPLAFSEVIAAKYALSDIPVLSNDISRDEPAFEQGSGSLSVTVYIPFKGDPELFRYYNDSHVMPNPTFEVRDGSIIHTIALSKTESPTLDDKVARWVEIIENGLRQLRQMVPRYNELLVREARAEFDRRLDEIRANRAAAAQIAQSRIRVRKRNDGAEKVVIPLQRRSLPVVQRPQPHGNSVEYQIENAEYDDILSTITAMSHVMERSPSVFAEMNEESLRIILLVALNGVYEGQATAETFNGAGKTDILIRRVDRNVFIAECLMWKGPAYLLRKMNEQLFQYAMWNDSKLALIVFNRGGNFSNVVATMKQTINEHPQRIKDLPYSHYSGAR